MLILLASRADPTLVYSEALVRRFRCLNHTTTATMCLHDVSRRMPTDSVVSRLLTRSTDVRRPSCVVGSTYKLTWAVHTNWNAAHTPSTVHRLVTNYAPSSSDGWQSPRERASDVTRRRRHGRLLNSQSRAAAAARRLVMMMLGGPTHLEARPLHGRNNLAQSGSKDHR